MPTYEYECKECSHNFEVFQAMSDEPLKICPKCGKEVRRLIFGGAGVIFKGSGFYVTDKATDKSKASSSKSSGVETKTAETSSDATQSSPCTEAKKTTACGNCPANTGSEGKSRKDAQTA